MAATTLDLRRPVGAAAQPSAPLTLGRTSSTSVTQPQTSTSATSYGGTGAISTSLAQPSRVAKPPASTSTAGAYGGGGAISTMSPGGWTAAPSAAQPQAAFTRPAYAPGSTITGASSNHSTLTTPNPFGTGAYDMTPPSTLQAPGNNMANPGYSEQGLEATQNRLLEDPYAAQMQSQYQQTQNPSQGEDYLNQNLGSLQGPGAGEQYWSQVAGQFQDPFAGEQYARQATENYSPTGAASAFYDQAQQQYQDFTGYQGPQNAQGQYQQNAAYGPNASQSFYDQAQGDYETRGTYDDPNRAAGQYEQTQQAFGDLPIAEFDPFYDRARQLGVQSYNQNAAGRGVYGSSEALSGVGNVITDIEAQRANRSFDAEMQRAQELRARQGLLGEQARMGDLSGVAAFGANLAGTETYGNLANQAASQTTAQQTMLGNQANMADSQALGAQQANLEGLNIYGDLASSADSAESRRYEGSTNAMNQADRTALDRLGVGADAAFRVDDSNRADYATEAGAAANAANIGDQRTNTGIRAGDVGSDNDLARLDEFGEQSHTAEQDRQDRLQSEMDQAASLSRDVASVLGEAQDALLNADQKTFEDSWNAKILPALQAAGMSVQEQAAMRQTLMQVLQIGINATE